MIQAVVDGSSKLSDERPQSGGSHDTQLKHHSQVVADGPMLGELAVIDAKPVALRVAESLAAWGEEPIQPPQIRAGCSDPRSDEVTFGNQCLDVEVEVGELPEDPFHRLSHRGRAVDLAGTRRGKGCRAVLDETLGHERGAGREIALVPHLLEMAPNQIDLNR